MLRGCRRLPRSAYHASTGGLLRGAVLPVSPRAVSFSKFLEPDTHDLLRTSSRGCHEDATRKLPRCNFGLQQRRLSTSRQQVGAINLPRSVVTKLRPAIEPATLHRCATPVFLIVWIVFLARGSQGRVERLCWWSRLPRTQLVDVRCGSRSLNEPFFCTRDAS